MGLVTAGGAARASCALLLIMWTIESAKGDQIYYSSSQEMDVQCSSSNGAVLLPQHYVPGSTPGGDPVMLGPLFPGQFLVCQAGTVPQSTCKASFSDLAVADPVMCGPFILLSCPLCKSTAAALNSTSAAAPSVPQQPYCNGTLHLMASTGCFTDGSPGGSDYAPGSFCQWLIDPGYRQVRLNITRFATEQSFDWVYILQLSSSGFQSVLEKLSGNLSQVPSSITVASSRAAVAFLSDGSNQDTGFEMVWDQGIFCDPMTHLYSPTGTFTDGTPVGERYRPYTHCEWLIEPGYGPIRLSFDRFSLAPGDTLDVFIGTLADPSRLLASYRGTETPQDLIAAEEASADLVIMNGTVTEAVLVVLHVADGSLLGSGFSASYSGLAQVTEGRAGEWGFSKGAAAGIIIGAVIFGLLAGVATGCAVIRCCAMYATISSGGRLEHLWGFGWLEHFQERRHLRWQRQVTSEHNQAEPLASIGTGNHDGTEEA